MGSFLDKIAQATQHAQERLLQPTTPEQANNGQAWTIQETAVIHQACMVDLIAPPGPAAFNVEAMSIRAKLEPPELQLLKDGLLVYINLRSKNSQRPRVELARLLLRHMPPSPAFLELNPAIFDPSDTLCFSLILGCDLPKPTAVTLTLAGKVFLWQ